MRTLFVFGARPEFAQAYSAFLAKNGFEPLKYSKAGGGPDCVRPVILIFDRELSASEDRLLEKALTACRKSPVIIASDGPPGGSASLKKARSRALSHLREGFLKRELQASLKSADELAGLREQVGSLQDELGRKSVELSSILEVTSLLASSTDLSKAISKIMERTRAMVGAETWAIYLVDEINRCLVFNSAKGVPPSRDVHIRQMPGEGISGWVMHDMEPKLVNDVTAERRFNGVLDGVTGVKASSVMAVPISVKNRLLGVVELINKETPSGFTEEDLDMVQVLMNQTALAVERSELYQRMEDLVITDDLTKLFNLRYLDRTLDVEIERATRYNLSVSLIFMDVDFFKHVNDRYGHLVGSKLLVEVSQLLLKGLRKVDIVARYGGDEFVIVLPQTGIDAAKMIAERLRKSIERHVFLKSESLELRLTASFGIASYPEHAATQEELLRLADEAMYRVKYHTRNDVYVVGS